MNNIKNILSGKLINPVTGKKIIVPIKEIHIESDVLHKIPAFCKAQGLGKKIAIVSDENTHIAAGAEVERMLAGESYEVFSIVLDGEGRNNVKADGDNVEMLKQYSSVVDVVIAVGSGTISDLCKYSTFLVGKPYICVPTAPSVNGYSSANASIEINGVKKSLPAHLPLAIFFDIDIQVQAPYRLIVAGLGDALARSTAQTDWLLSHYIMGAEYNPLPFEILKEDERIVFDNAEKLPLRDYETLKALCNLSVLSGLGMFIANSSKPASQAEHLMAHYMEMMFEGKYPHTYHGEQIAVTSIAAAKLQKEVLSMAELQVSPTFYNEKPLLTYFGQERGVEFLRELAVKEISEERARKINQNLRENWTKIKNEIIPNFIMPEELENIIRRANGPYTYKHLGWNHTDFSQAVKHSLFMRDRFTVLDIAMIMQQDNRMVS